MPCGAWRSSRADSHAHGAALGTHPVRPKLVLGRCGPPVSSDDGTRDGGAAGSGSHLTTPTRPPRDRRGVRTVNRLSIRKPPEAPGDPEAPIVAELFSVERLEQHAESLAEAQRVTSDPRAGRAIMPRLSDNGRVLLDAYRALADTIREERTITPAAEWLVDNFHIVDEQLREIRDDLPDGLLPRAAEARGGASRGLSARLRPRLGVRRAHRQPVRPGEPAPFRPRVPARRAADDRRALGGRDQPAHRPRREPPPTAERIVRGRAARERADELADGLLGLGAGQPVDAGEGRSAADRHATLDSGARAARPAAARPGPGDDTRASLAGGAARGAGHDRRGDRAARAPAPGRHERDRPQRDHEHAPHLVVRLGAVRRERQPGRRGARAHSVVRGDGLRHPRPVPPRHRGACSRGGQVRDRGRTSCRRGGAGGWRPCRCRSGRGRRLRVERERQADPGYYLISAGPAPFRAIPRRSGRFVDACDAAAGSARLYVGAIVLATASDRRLGAARRRSPGRPGRGCSSWRSSRWYLASDLAVALVNRVVIRGARAATASAARADAGRADSAANPRRRPDAAHERGRRRGAGRPPRDPLPREPGRRPPLRAAHGLARRADGAARRRRRRSCPRRSPRHRRAQRAPGEAPGGGARFLLLHRRRRWNESEGRWMGWERKRGKLHELNRLLRGRDDTTSSPPDGRPRAPRGRPLRDHARRRHAAAAGRPRHAWSARWRIR